MGIDRGLKLFEQVWIERMCKNKFVIAMFEIVWRGLNRDWNRLVMILSSRFENYWQIIGIGRGLRLFEEVWIEIGIVSWWFRGVGLKIIDK